MVISGKRCWALDPSGWDYAPLKCKQTVSSIVLIISNFLFEGVTPSSLQMNFSPPTPSPPLLLNALLWMLLPNLLIKAGINLPESWGTDLQLEIYPCEFLPVGESRTWQCLSSVSTAVSLVMCGWLWAELGFKGGHFPSLFLGNNCLITHCKACVALRVRPGFISPTLMVWKMSRVQCFSAAEKLSD